MFYCHTLDNLEAFQNTVPRGTNDLLLEMSKVDQSRKRRDIFYSLL